MNPKAFLLDILHRYNFRDVAADDILAHVDVEILDPESTQGGGTVLPAGDRHWRIVLYSGQHEACVHECAHVWWYLNQNDNRVASLVGIFLHQAELTAHPRFRKIRDLCKLYRDGDGHDWPGMWIGEPYNRWNADEIFAGLASATMGDMDLYPPEFRQIYDQMYSQRQLVYLPTILA